MGSALTHIAARLEGQGAEMIRFFAYLSASEWARVVYADDNTEPWTVRKLAAHLLSAETGFHELVRDILAGGEGAPTGMDIDDFNAEQVSLRDDLPPAALVEALAAARAANVSLVCTLTDVDLQRTGRHPFLGWTTLDKQLKLIYRHAMLHIRDVNRLEG